MAAAKKTVAKKTSATKPTDLDKALGIVTRLVENHDDPASVGHKTAVTQAKRFLTQHGVKA